EGQVWRKYVRHAERSYPPDIADVLRRNARDEEAHYAWVTTALDHLGVGAGTATGTVASMVETFHGAAADVIEAVERVGIELMVRGRQR
ncbi:MAG TPA: hypothetical protein VFO41_05555, partial [Alphaproteobacteria bacterium]|nr:hypothetical protein [Alphaproteobacteria bacterium]